MIKKLLSILVLITAFSLQASEVSGADQEHSKLNAWAETSLKKSETWAKDHKENLETAFAEAVKEEADAKTNEGRKSLDDDDKVLAGRHAYHALAQQIEDLNNLSLQTFDAELWIKSLIKALGKEQLTVSDLSYVVDSRSESVLTYLVQTAYDREVEAVGEIKKGGVAKEDIAYEADLFLIGFICRNSTLSALKSKKGETPSEWYSKQAFHTYSLPEFIIVNDQIRVAARKSVR